MHKRHEGQAADKLGAAPSAFLRLSDDGAAELDTRSPRKSAGVLALLLIALFAAPLFWATHAQAKAGDQTLAVKSNSGHGDDDDQGDDGDDGPNDDNSGTNATHPGNTGPGASQHGGQGVGGDDTNNGHQTNASNENTATNTANTGDGPNTNTN